MFEVHTFGAPEIQSYLHQLIQHHSIETRQILDVVSLHHRAVFSDMSSELLHVEDQLCYVSAKCKTLSTHN